MLFNHHHDWMPPTYWTAELSDGTYVVQDERFGLEPCWLRLKKHCEENSLFIVGIIFQFRTNIIEMPRNKEGYYFSKAASAFIGQETYEQYVFGYLEEDDNVYINYYKIPELIVMDSFIRPKNECLEKLIIGSAKKFSESPCL